MQTETVFLIEVSDIQAVVLDCPCGGQIHLPSSRRNPFPAGCLPVGCPSCGTTFGSMFLKAAESIFDNLMSLRDCNIKTLKMKVKAV